MADSDESENSIVFKKENSGITKIGVAGFKSIGEERIAEIRPLTILAGANSSGKSSMMQPLLLMKQTLEAAFDPGPLLLNGPNIRFTMADQLLSKTRGKRSPKFTVQIHSLGFGVAVTYDKGEARTGFRIASMTDYEDDEKHTIRPGMTTDELKKAFVRRGAMSTLFDQPDTIWSVRRDRSFLEADIVTGPESQVRFKTTLVSAAEISEVIRKTIHLPGLRGNPERAYPLTAVGTTFSGTFEKYTASVIAQWQRDKEEARLEALNSDLALLGLTWSVSAQRIDDTQVEIRVGRLREPLRGGGRDVVNIADVGIGVSQTLPILVALRTAKPGTLVYIEQPEIHLHPSAQVQLAAVLSDAAIRGVRVVVETHSHLLLMGIQSLVAEEKLEKDLAVLHWFERDKDGMTSVTSRYLDESGAYGDWPEDFAQVALDTESRYLDATVFKNVKGGK